MDEGIIMTDEKIFINLLSDFYEPIEFVETLIMQPRDDKKKNKKKKKYIKNIYGEFVECEDDYDYDREYEVMRYPPDSNPPNPDNKLILQSHYMIINQTN